MSFEQRHRRQVSSADTSITKEEGKTEDFDKTILHIQRKLDQLPAQYKQSSTAFNPLEQVIDMMKSTNLKERKKDLDTNVRTLDKAMESIVKGTFFIYLTKCYAH
jgi:chromosome segregation ATPase